jgi:hypothetical protein
MRARSAPFAQRAAALDALDQGGHGDATALEARQTRAVRRLQARVAHGRFTPEGLRRAFRRLVDATQPYDALDELWSRLFIPQVPEEPRIILDPDAVAYQPTPARAVLQLLERLPLSDADLVYDLGSGLGLVVQALALLSPARAVGLELEPSYLSSSERSAQALHLHRARFQMSDLKLADLRGATVYYLYTPLRGKALEDLFARIQGASREREVRIATYGPCTKAAGRQMWLVPRSGDVTKEDEVVVWGKR